MAAARDPLSEFRQSLLDLDNRLLRGEPFSGHERKCAFLNTGAERWATVSHVSGFDFEDDARALAATDWDGDGDVDVWVSNRTAPMVRYLRNDTPRAGDFVTLKLHQDHGNRDAIGAKVQVRLAAKNARPLLRELRAGDGFLAQSTQRLHFGLGPKAEIAEVTVRWPGGTRETFTGVKPNAAWRLRMGTGKAEPLPDPHKNPAALKTGPVTLPPGEFPVAVPLAMTLPLPAIGFTDLSGKTRLLAELKGAPVLLNLCSGDLDPCRKQLEHWIEHLPKLSAAGLRLFVAGMDDGKATRDLLAGLPAGIERGILTPHAKERLAYLYNLPFEIDLRLAAPSSMMLDTGLRYLMLYRGGAGIDQLLQDVKRASFTPQELEASAMPFNGVWLKPPAAWAPLELITTLLKQNDWDAADDYMIANREEFRISLRYPATVRLLAEALTNQNRPVRAIPHYRDCLKDFPGDPALLNNLAHNLIHQPRPDAAAISEAVSHAVQAVELTRHEDPAMLDTLARAFLAAGKNDEALKAARKAVALAKEKGLTELSASLDGLLKSMAKSG